MAINYNYYIDVLKYDILRRPQSFDYTVIPQSFSFDSNYDKDRDLHWLESKEMPDFYVTGSNKVELASRVGDTLLVYFNVPTYFAKKWKPETTTFNFENKKTGEQEYVSLAYEEELRKASV